MMCLPRNRNLRLSIVGLCAAFMLAACGDDSSSGKKKSSDDNNTSSNNTSSNNTSSNNTSGDAQKSSFDVEVEGDGSKESYKETQDNSQASNESLGAAITDSTLTIYLVSSAGVTMQAVVETSEDNMAPGTFTAGDFMDGATTHVSLVDAMAGNAFNSDGTGSIRLDNCPRMVGEKIVGAFQNIVLKADSGNATRTLNGSFDIAVYAKAGDLFCHEPSTGNNDGGNNDANNTNNTNNTNNDGGTCRADECVEGGTCCPYMDCIAQCEWNCWTSDTDCAGGMNPAACAACSNGCLDECNVSGECRTAMVDLYTCGEDNGCEDIEDEDAYDACYKGNCCSEINAAF